MRAARSLWARKASAARKMLSRKANMHLRDYSAPVLSGVDDQLARFTGEHQVVYALAIDFDRARIDFAHCITD